MAFNLINIYPIILAILLPIFGKLITFPENIFLYSIPLLIYIVSFFKKKSFDISSKSIKFLLILLGLFLVSTIYSQNIGISFNYFLIFLNSAFIFLLLVSLTNKSYFNAAFLIFSLIYSIIFLLNKIHLFPLSVQNNSDNFILQVWGHSNLSDFIVLSIPIFLSRLTPKNYHKYIIPILIVSTALFLTQSRSAFVALGLGLLFYQTKQLSPANLRIAKSLGIFIGIIAVFYLSANNTLSKKSAITDRIEIWQQGLYGFIKSPLYGNGPGNFFLVNNQYQENNKATYFSHSSFLGFLCENGIFFTVLFFIFIILALRQSFKKNNLYFVVSIIAVTASFLDSTWNSPGIFIISLYFIFYEAIKTSDSNNQSPRQYFSAFFIIVLFFFIQTSLAALFFHFQNYPQSIAINPFDIYNRNTLTNVPNINSQLRQKNIDDTLRYFPNQPSVYLSLIRSTDFPQAETYYLKLVQLMPNANGKYLLPLYKYYTQNRYQDKLIYLTDTYVINPKINQSSFPEAQDLATYYYQIAVSIYPQQPEKAIAYLQQAIANSPEQSHFYIELANAYWYINQKDKALEQLKTCQTHQYAAPHCTTYLDEHQNSKFEWVGFYLSVFKNQ